MRLASNVVAHEPETNPSKIDVERLRARGWPETLISRVQQQPFGSDILKEFEQQVTESEAGEPAAGGAAENSFPDAPTATSSS
jgi:hypothetical protein